ncbi:Exosome complex component RRP46 [Strongyloides ratti]|uniref:Exosome complex component RRP46 n=1 Tax=Strongyloides ratti TaxID=34506 RepID=A0A090LK28_STRRB|nr:Exosome complex component RRP46 [Strongyloides ratti]CEF70068.1 Exosome complex component RRP46 [Strongyloides ratti]
MSSFDVKEEIVSEDKVNVLNVSEDGMIEAKALGSIKCQLKFIQRADGSCAYSRNGNMLICSVNGPSDVKQDFRNDKEMFVDLTISGAKDRCSQFQLQHVILPIIRGALVLENYPRASDCINAIFLALLDNGIEMKYQFCAITVIQEKVSRKFILNPTKEEQINAECTYELVYKPSLTNGADLIGIECIGNFIFQEFEDACRIGVKASSTIFDFYRNLMSRSLQ